VGFLPEPDFCRIWKKCRIPAGAKIRYSRTFYVVVTCFVTIQVPEGLLCQWWTLLVVCRDDWERCDLNLNSPGGCWWAYMTYIHHSSVAVILWSDGVHWCRSDGDAQTTLPERYTGTRHLWANTYTRPVSRHCRHPTTSSGGKPLASLSESWNGLTFVNCVSACLQI